MALKENVKDLYEQIYSGKLLDAFDKYYHEDVVMQENSEEPRKGKAVNRDYELHFLDMVEAFHGGGVLSMTFNEEDQIAAVESWMEVTFKDGNRVKMSQVAVQKWQGDQVISERFYHA